MTDQQRRGDTTAPKFTSLLMKEMGVARASRLLGVSTTTLHKARKINEVSRVIEVAAEGALQRHRGPVAEPTPAVQQLHPSTPAKKLYLVEVPQTASELLEKLTAAVGGSLLAA